MSLTNRIAAILNCAPQTAADIWDALGDSTLRLADVVTELRAMTADGIADREGLIGCPCVYRRALAVAS